MELNIHGKVISYDGKECGMYVNARDLSAYARINVPSFVDDLNNLPQEQARDIADSYRTIVGNQLLRVELRRIFPPLEEILTPNRNREANFFFEKQYLQNTERLMGDILKILQE